MSKQDRVHSLLVAMNAAEVDLDLAARDVASALDDLDAARKVYTEKSDAFLNAKLVYEDATNDRRK